MSKILEKSGNSMRKKMKVPCSLSYDQGQVLTETLMDQIRVFI